MYRDLSLFRYSPYDIRSRHSPASDQAPVFQLHTATRLHQMYEGAIQPCLHTLGCGVDAFDENYEHILALTETGEMYQLGTTITLNSPEPAPISHILMSSLEFWIIVAILMHQVSMISIIMGIPCQTRSSRDGGVQMSNLLSALGTEDGPQGRP